jgi:hypothetical protein
MFLFDSANHDFSPEKECEEGKIVTRDWGNPPEE